MSSIYGRIPKDFVLLVACDEVYAREHLSVFVKSASINGNRTHAHLIDPSAETLARAELLRSWNFSYTFESDKLVTNNLEAARIYYACSRFFMATFLLSRGSGPLLVLDVDAVVRGFIDRNDFQDFQVFRRDPIGVNDWERYATHVAAGAVFYSDREKGLRAAEFVDREIKSYFESGQQRWFIDQAALYSALSTYGGDPPIDKKYIDWDFDDSTLVWTAKGDRKNAQRYLEERRKYE